jgi:hypothetical protein
MPALFEPLLLQRSATQWYSVVLSGTQWYSVVLSAAVQPWRGLHAAPCYRLPDCGVRAARGALQRAHCWTEELTLTCLRRMVGRGAHSTKLTQIFAR